MQEFAPGFQERAGYIPTAIVLTGFGETLRPEVVIDRLDPRSSGSDLQGVGDGVMVLWGSQMNADKTDKHRWIFLICVYPSAP
jgi:hypothetical protein